jgi:hypothetical protein
LLYRSQCQSPQISSSAKQHPRSESLQEQRQAKVHFSHPRDDVLIAFEGVGENTFVHAPGVDEVDGNVIADKIQATLLPTVPFRVGQHISSDGYVRIDRYPLQEYA